MFKFDFKVDENDLEIKNAFEDKDNINTKDSKTDESTIEIHESQQVIPTEDTLENLDLYRVNSMEITAGDVTISYIKSGYLLQMFDTDSTKDIKKAEQNHSDLIPGVYEGGAKIWECTDDLIGYMATHYPPDKLNKRKVLDLGCGAGVLGIYAHACGATVHFQDYNQDVLEKITIPNLALNLNESEVNNFENVKFFSGDWSKYAELTKDDDLFDVILTSETIYNPENQQKLLNTFNAKLKEEGVVLLAAKVYYFGVGGGLRQFEELIKTDNRFQSRVLWNSTEGLSREILEITRITRT